MEKPNYWSWRESWAQQCMKMQMNNRIQGWLESQRHFLHSFCSTPFLRQLQMQIIINQKSPALWFKNHILAIQPWFSHIPSLDLNFSVYKINELNKFMWIVSSGSDTPRFPVTMCSKWRYSPLPLADFPPPPRPAFSPPRTVHDPGPPKWYQAAKQSHLSTTISTIRIQSIHWWFTTCR